MIRRQLLILFIVLGYFHGLAQKTEFPFYNDIAKFKESDKLYPPDKNAILFIGSSSFTLWKDVQDYFPGYKIINRGFGGSTLVDQLHFLDDIVFPYSPRQIVIYCGENDIASSDTITSEMVIQRFKMLYQLIRARLPSIQISYISMKPSPLRWSMADRMKKANSGIQEYIATQPNCSYINVWDAMLSTDFRPDSSIFLEDMLHMNAKGYAIWQKLIQPDLIK